MWSCACGFQSGRDLKWLPRLSYYEIYKSVRREGERDRERREGERERERRCMPSFQREKKKMQTFFSPTCLKLLLQPLQLAKKAMFICLSAVDIWPVHRPCPSLFLLHNFDTMKQYRKTNKALLTERKDLSYILTHSWIQVTRVN